MKGSSDFYKEQLQNWSETKALKKVTEKSERTSNENLSMFIEWIKKQPDDCTVQQLKEALCQNQSISEDLESSSLQINLEGKSADITLKELIEKNEELSTSLYHIENELRKKAEGLDTLKEKIEYLNKQLIEKESALIEEKSLNELLTAKLNDLSSVDKLSTNRRIVELKNELESRCLEIVILQTKNVQLESSVEQYKCSTNVYLSTIDELKQKLHLLRLDNCDKLATGDNSRSQDSELSSLENLECLSEIATVSVATQTPKCKPAKSSNKEFISYSSCMARAVEELLHQISQK